MRINTLAVITFVLFLISVPFYTSAKNVNLPTREDVQVKVWVETPKPSHAVVVLFTGGNGVLDIDEYGISRAGNFLIRSRFNFVEHGYTVIIPDVPSDQDGLLFFRTTSEYLQDMQALLAWINTQYKNKPVYLIGTSRGTISVVSIAAGIDVEKYSVKGIILTASVMRESHSGKQSVYDVSLENITTPALFVHHEQDECYVTLYEDIYKLFHTFKRVNDKQMISYSDGINEGHPCRSRSYHGFNGIEKQVVSDIVLWMKAR